MEQDMASSLTDPALAPYLGNASISNHSHSINDPGHGHGIAAQLSQYQNQMNQQLANQIGNSTFLGAVQPQVATPPKKVDPSWTVSIVKVENGFMVTVMDQLTSKSLRYVASDISGVTEMIAAGLVTGRVES
jgi:hypothetical protein